MIRLLDEELDTLTTTDDSNQLLCNLCQAAKFQHVFKDGAYYCYCAYVPISYRQCLLIQGYFCAI